MQKENEILNGSERDEELISSTESKPNSDTVNNGSENEALTAAQSSQPEKEDNKKSCSDEEFEELIKGPFKDAFAQKVQSIISKRFKEQKIAENKSANGEAAKNTNGASAEITQKGSCSADQSDPAYDNLLKAGVDRETAYRVLHLNEFMDSSMRYGAELAAKQIADSIRQKSARPSESALLGKGYVAKASVSTLTPQKRKELAKKALMGEEIEF